MKDNGIADASTLNAVLDWNGGARRPPIAPDVAACEDCVAEIFDPLNRRYRYAFTSCAHCGPAFSTAIDVPYQRTSTTMARFAMCPACQREYEDATDRRFLAVLNACPSCGPRLALRRRDGAAAASDDVIAAAAVALRDGAIVAVKDISGFHLVCDATSDAVVRELRRRRRRDEKPMPVMIANLDVASAHATLDHEAAAWLTAAERPIVLVPRGEEATIAESGAAGNRMGGLMRPHSPLQHLLLADTGRPLVMTAGALCDEPIARDNAEALRRLGEVADLFLDHDLEIASRADDSIVAVIAARATIVRRSRGFVPRGIELTREFVRPVLACGTSLRNTFCLAAGTTAWLGPHVGGLEHPEACGVYAAAIARMERFLRIRPEVIVHDLDPDHPTTDYAMKRPEQPRIAVQHHHAHVVSAMAEHRVAGPAIGIAYDGGGYGTDGSLWGGEVMVATADTFRRVATYRPLRLVGGDASVVRAPWRLALALVDDAFDGYVPPALRPRFARIPDVEAVQEMLRRGISVVPGRGVGRYFDAFGSLFLARTRASFGGQVAIEWTHVADPSVTRAYPFDLAVVSNGSATSDGWLLEIDLRPAIRAAVADYTDHVGVGEIAAAVQNTIASATFAVVRNVVINTGPLPIVASGGCFQNALLAERVRAALEPEHEVLFHRVVPPGDGGIPLGQAVIANALASRRHG